MALWLGRGAAIELVGQDDFVKIHGDGNFILGKIAEPRSIAPNCVGKEWKNFPQWNCYFRLLRLQYLNRGILL